MNDEAYYAATSHISWPKNPQCSACLKKPCGTWNTGHEWHSLCCNARLVGAKLAEVTA